MRALAALRMVWACVIMTRQIKSVSTGKKSPLSVHLGEPGHTRDTRAHGHTDHTDEPHNQPNPHQRTRTAQPRDDRTAADSYNKQPQPRTRSRPLPAANSEEAGTGAALMTACPGHVDLAFHHR
jgi:hypothetical protein